MPRKKIDGRHKICCQGEIEGKKEIDGQEKIDGHVEIDRRDEIPPAAGRQGRPAWRSGS
ncbi:MAG: hypothetical protein LBW85_07555 [Deltaproteobacteria bacterium]|nr:hypothetical protein [Deltaproteobacteria bacterium]